MHDPEFEKAVRQKMEELKFTPSASAWSNVEKEINKNRKRRRPILWFFLFLGVAFSGSLYWMLNRQAGSHTIAIKPSSTSSSSQSKNEKPSAASDRPAGISSNTAAAPSDKTADGATAGKKTAAQTAGIDIKVVDQVDQNEQNNSRSNHKVSHTISHTKKIISPKNTDQPVNAANTYSGDEQKKNNLPNSTDISTAGNNAEKNIAKNNSAPVNAAKKSAETAAVPPVDNHSEKTVADKTSIASVSEKNSTVQTKNKSKNRWSVGFTGNTGISLISPDHFAKSVALTPQTITLAAAAARPPYYYTGPSNIKPGFSFGAGVFVRRQWGKRFSLSAGINYQYYSTTMRVGSESAYTSFGGSSNGNLNLLAAGSYYQSGNSEVYTNHYHYLELPFAAMYQLNRSKKFPVFWEAGIAVAELLSSDGLHFDDTYGVYYKDMSLFNKTQWNAATAVMIGIPWKNNSLSVGPQFRYDMTNLINDKTVPGQHLYSVGLRFVFVPGKH